MDQLLDKCDCKIGITDNLTIHDKNDAKHNQHLCSFMHIASDYGFILNPEKSVVKAALVACFRCVYDAQDFHSDLHKAIAIHIMSPPESVPWL